MKRSWCWLQRESWRRPAPSRIRAGSQPKRAESAARSTEWLLPNHDYAGVRFSTRIRSPRQRPDAPGMHISGADLTAPEQSIGVPGCNTYAATPVYFRAGSDNPQGEMAPRLKTEGQRRKRFDQESWVWPSGHC
jgi:hypothetical protein